MKAGHPSSRLTEHTAILLGTLGGASGLGGLCVAHWLASDGLLGVSFCGVATLLLAVLAWTHARVERLATDEHVQREQDEPRDSDLFGRGELAGDRDRVLQQFEERFVPACTCVLAICEGGVAYLLWHWRQFAVKSPLESEHFHPGFVLGIGVAGFALFLVGKYAAGLGYAGGRRHLRAPAAMSVITALFGVTVVAAFVASRLAVSSESVRFRNPDPFLLIAGAVVFAALAFEHLLGLVLALYRPREARPEAAVLYESRLAGLAAHPEGVWQGFAEFLDYQFGFSLSGTGFCQVCRRAILPLLIFQVTCLFILSCVIGVPAGRQAFRERLGMVVGSALGPGIHLKLPWPLERVRSCPGEWVVRFTVGSRFAQGEGARQPALWSDMPEDALLYLTADSAAAGEKRQGRAGADLPSGVAQRAPAVNLVVAEATVEYRVSDARDYIYNHMDPERLLRVLAQRELTRCLASHDGVAMLQGNWRDLSEGVRLVLDRATGPEGLSLGVEVMSVTMTRLQPPVTGDVVAAFHRSMIEQQRSTAALFEAEQYRSRVLPESRSTAELLLSAARSYHTTRIATARADAEAFAAKQELYDRYEQLYEQFAYLERLEQFLGSTRKIVVATDIDDQIISVDLKSELTPDLLDLAAPGGVEK